MAQQKINQPQIQDYENGSNANGTWVKYPDGTMICRHMVSVAGPSNLSGSVFYYSPAPTDWTYPQTFVGVPVLSASHSSGAADMLAVGKNASASACNVALMGGRSRTGNYDVQVSAVGRWK